MNDAKNNPITKGARLRRIIDDRAAYVGHEYTVVERVWHEGDTGPSLVADGGFISELLSPERCKEYEVI